MPIILALLACGTPDNEINGSVAGTSLSKPMSAWWGGPFILFTDIELSCYDTAWVRRTYDAAESPTDFDVTALQFGFDNEEPLEGIFSVEGEAAVAAKAVFVVGGAFVEYRGRQGNLEVDSIEGDLMEGSFDITFDDGSYSTEYFSAEYCSNLIRN